MEWDGKRSRLLISTARRSLRGGRDGSIQALTLPLEAVARPIPLDVEQRPCTSGRFVPIGIFLREEGGETWLYAVAKRAGNVRLHAIEKYRVEDTRLVYVNRFASEFLTRPNAVVALPGDELYVSNATGTSGPKGLFEQVFQKPWGTIAHRFPGREDRWEFSKVRIAFPNGLALRPSTEGDEDRLLVAAFNEKRILSFRREPGTGTLEPRREETVPLPARPDNLKWHGEELLVAAHPSRLKTLLHLSGLRSSAPSVVYRVGPDHCAQPIFRNGGKEIAGSSTAIIRDGLLYVSQVRKPFLGVCEPEHTPIP